MSQLDDLQPAQPDNSQPAQPDNSPSAGHPSQFDSTLETPPSQPGIVLQHDEPPPKTSPLQSTLDDGGCLMEPRDSDLCASSPNSIQ